MRMLVIAVAVLLASSMASGRTWYVRPDGTGDAPTIQAAVDSAHAGDEIVLESGVFSGSGNRDINFCTDSISVRSIAGDPAACIIDCESATRGFKFYSTLGKPSRVEGISIDGITIRNGYASVGAAMHATFAGISVDSCIFEYNDACAVYLDFPSVVYFTNCMFRDNRRFLYTVDGYVRFTDCTFFHNYGMAILEYNAAATLTRCTVYRNGGSFQICDGSTLGCTSCTFWYNNSGSGLFWIDTIEYFPVLLRLTNCVVANSYSGCPVTIYNGWDDDNEIRIYCTDIYGNAGGDWVGPIAGRQGRDGNFSACPSFCDTDWGDFHLCDGSPCVPGNHPAGYNCGLIGAWDIGCSCGPSRIEKTTWGSIKAMYR